VLGIGHKTIEKILRRTFGGGRNGGSSESGGRNARGSEIEKETTGRGSW